MQKTSQTTHRQLILTILESAVANVQLAEDEINDLNIFPVPDGDTGSNMLATLIAAWNNISQSAMTDIEIFNDFARGALLGARGNSGVITSQIIKGIAVGVEEVNVFSRKVEDLRKIFRYAKEYAYNAVADPVEGTILSVVRALDENYKRDTDSFTEVFKDVIEIARKATQRTPEQLPILKESGVVDSGAFGLVKFIEGAILGMEGKGVKLNVEIPESAIPKAKFQKADPTKNIGYCTEFILTLKDPEGFDKVQFKEYLESIGDSIVMIKEDDILKVHVHAKDPGNIFSAAQKHGEFSNIKAENMSTQTEMIGHKVEGGSFNITKNKPEELGIIAISNGRGLDKEFSDLGVDAIISGGQSMNPSVEEFMEYVEKLPNDKILILPNNSNIILTAETVKKNVSNKEIFVLPTKTLSQGLVALGNINKEMTNFDDFAKGITKEFKSISEGQITIAVRDTEMNGLTVKKGQFISIKGKKIISSTKTFDESFKALVDIIVDSGVDVVNFLYNDEVSSEQYEMTKTYMEHKHKDIDFEIKYGGQAIYHAIIFGED